MSQTIRALVPRFQKPIAIALPLFLILGMGAWGHSGATGIVKQRMEAMSAMAKAMKTVGSMIKGETDFTPAALAPAARVLIQHGQAIPKHFPDNPDSRGGKTEALPEVWQRWPRFAELAEQLVLQASALEASAHEGTRETITRRFAAITKTCRDCHSVFRRPKD